MDRRTVLEAIGRQQIAGWEGRFAGLRELPGTGHDPLADTLPQLRGLWSDLLRFTAIYGDDPTRLLLPGGHAFPAYWLGLVRRGEVRAQEFPETADTPKPPARKSPGSPLRTAPPQAEERIPGDRERKQTGLAARGKPESPEEPAGKENASEDDRPVEGREGTNPEEAGSPVSLREKTSGTPVDGHTFPENDPPATGPKPVTFNNLRDLAARWTGKPMPPESDTTLPHVQPEAPEYHSGNLEKGGMGSGTKQPGTISFKGLKDFGAVFGKETPKADSGPYLRLVSMGQEVAEEMAGNDDAGVGVETQAHDSGVDSLPVTPPGMKTAGTVPREQSRQKKASKTTPKAAPKSVAQPGLAEAYRQWAGRFAALQRGKSLPIQAPGTVPETPAVNWPPARKATRNGKAKASGAGNSPAGGVPAEQPTVRYAPEAGWPSFPGAAPGTTEGFPPFGFVDAQSEFELDDLMEALAERLAREYKRHYGI